MVSQGPYSASLGETTTGTCWDFAFYHSEAGYYRVPVLHAASAEATIRLIKVLLVWMKIQVPDFTTLHVWSSSRVLPVDYALPLLFDSSWTLSCRKNSSPCWEIPVSACSSWLLVVCHRLGWSRADSLGFPLIMSLGVVLNVERVPPFIVWGIVRRGSNTPSGFSTSFLPGLIGFSSDLWVLALLIEIFCPGVRDDPASRRVPLLWKGQGVVGDLGFLGLEDWSPEWSFSGKMRDDPASRRVPLLWKGQGVVGDLGFLGLEDWSPEWSFSGKMRYLILLLGTPYLARVFWVPRYLTTCGDYTCGPSPSPSCGMKLLWAEPAGAYEFSADPRP
ncbi:hypothetical protein F2Q69_00030631 [Brassica cretica]|uniref:Uncharacterized protein n=1 Tax=Brassica cretica TaxID=69181 RepID=A0A8S9RYM0_BRACR|nr:hypothetical protein F2Q69_00030631 [Brassica cretica]